MTQETFPGMTFDSETSERVRFSEAHMRVLQQILDQEFAIWECENPEIIADWRASAQRPGGSMTHRSNIILYRDGADWAAAEEDGHYQGIGVLFCREDINQTIIPHTISYHVHLPNAEWQDQLLRCCVNLAGDVKQDHFSKRNEIHAYLESIINDQTAWKPLRQLVDDLDLDGEL